MSLKSYRVRCLSEVVSPLTHMSSTAGNVALVSTEPVATPDGEVEVSFISGNQIRHKLVREPGFRWLLDRWGLAGLLDEDQLQFLYNGGRNTKAGQFEDLRRIDEWKAVFPLGRLVGGCMSDQTLHGSLDVWRARLVCEENRQFLPCDLPDPAPIARRLRRADSFLGDYQYTRGDARSKETGYADAEEIAAKDAAARSDPKAKEKSDKMIFAGRCVIVGALFTHGFLLKHVSELEVGALLLSMRLWEENDGTAGGQAGKGHGRLRLWAHLERLDQDALVGRYVDHCDAMRERGVAWLSREFEKARKAEGQKAKAKKGAA